MLQQTDKKLEVIQEVVLLEAFKVNDLKEQEIKRFNIYIVLFRRKILEKKWIHNGFIAFIVVTQIVPPIDGSFYRLIKSSILQ